MTTILYKFFGYVRGLVLLVAILAMAIPAQAQLFLTKPGLVTLTSNQTTLTFTGTITAGPTNMALANVTAAAPLAVFQPTNAPTISNTAANPVPVYSPTNKVGGFTYIYQGALDMAATFPITTFVAGDTWAAQLPLPALRENSGTGTALSFGVFSKDDTAPAITLLLFSGAVGTTNAISSAWNMAATDATNYIDKVDIAASDYTDIGTNRVATVTKTIPVKNTSGTNYIWVGFVAQDTTIVTNVPIFTIGVLQD